MKKLHISKLTISKYKEGDELIGPWCLTKEDFIKNKYKYLTNYDKNVYQYKEDYIKQNSFKNQLIIYLGEKLNTYHNSDFTNEFWRILLERWVVSIVEAFFMLYESIEKISNNNEDYTVETDVTFLYNRLDHPVQISLMNPDNYVHSILSFIIENGNFENITFEKSNIIDLEQDIFLKLKQSSKKNLLKKYVKKVLYSKNGRIVSFINIAGISFLEMIRLRFFSNIDISFAFREKEPYCRDDNKKNYIDLGDFNTTNKQENLLLQFIECNLPKKLTKEFKLYFDKTIYAENKLIGISSPGCYQDEQLFELAKIKANNGKIVCSSPDIVELGLFQSVVLFDNSDYFLSNGNTEGEGIVDPKSKFMSISHKRYKKLLNKHKEENEYILYYGFYLGQYKLVSLSSHQIYRSYLDRKIEFIKKIEKNGYSSKLLFKPHPGRKHAFPNEEEIIQREYNLNYNLYGEETKNVNIKNSAMFVLDYLSSSFIETLLLNKPTLFFLDKDTILLNENLEKYYSKFKKLGVAFDSPVDTASRISEVYPNRKDFWNSREIQNIRNDILNTFVNTHEHWYQGLKRVSNLG